MDRREILMLGGSVFIAGCTGTGQRRGESEMQRSTERDKTTEVETTEAETTTKKEQFGTSTATPSPTPRPQPYIKGERGVEGKVVKNPVTGLELELFRAKFYDDFFNVGMRAKNTTSSSITNVQAVCTFYSTNQKIGQGFSEAGEIPAGKSINMEFLLNKNLNKLDNFTIEIRVG